MVRSVSFELVDLSSGLMRTRRASVVITAAFRTPLCKAKKGQFKDTGSDELLISLFKAARSKIGVDPGVIGDM